MMKRPFNAIQLTPNGKHCKHRKIQRINNGAKVDPMEKCSRAWNIIRAAVSANACKKRDECQWEWGLDKYENTRINSFTMFLTFVYWYEKNFP